MTKPADAGPALTGLDMTDRLPTYAISHGGGPWPWAKKAIPTNWAPLESALSGIPDEIGVTPRAILMVTAHWEASVFMVQTNPSPPMMYDYSGFPPHTYEIQYPAPGSPELARRTLELLNGAGLPTGSDASRGFDHGTFVPAYVMYPKANVPVVQLSIHRGYDPLLHLQVGRALAPLRDEGILIVGSGLPTYHDLSSFGRTSAGPSRQFDRWLTETVVGHTGSARSDRLLSWADAPSARLAHPREDHFIPLLVAVGAAGEDSGIRNYHQSDLFGDTTSSGYGFGVSRGR